MAGFMLTLSLLTILITVGFLFAWMVRMASIPQQLDKMQDKGLSTPACSSKSSSVRP